LFQSTADYKIFHI
jgi:gamma-secretase subunit APH-1